MKKDLIKPVKNLLYFIFVLLSQLVLGQNRIYHGSNIDTTENGQVVISEFLPFAFFDYNSNILTESWKDSLNIWEPWTMVQTDSSYIILGLTGYYRKEEGLEMGQKRAQAVKDYYVSKGALSELIIIETDSVVVNDVPFIVEYNSQKHHFGNKLDKENNKPSGERLVASQLLLQIVIISIKYK